MEQSQEPFRKRDHTGNHSLSWHTAFFSAVQMELAEYKDSLEFIPEFPLTTEPLRIDCIIIKKAKNTIIKKNFTTIFREVNILEYKNPSRNFSIANFYKVYAYACLYTNIKKMHHNQLNYYICFKSLPEKIIQTFEK